jgi:hypothetical protein
MKKKKRGKATPITEYNQLHDEKKKKKKNKLQNNNNKQKIQKQQRYKI